MGPQRGVLACHLVFDLRPSLKAPAVPVRVELSYDSRDPFAIRADFHTGDGPVRWVFGRDLLAAGLDGRPVTVT